MQVPIHNNNKKSSLDKLSVAVQIPESPRIYVCYSIHKHTHKHTHSALPCVPPSRYKGGGGGGGRDNCDKDVQVL